MKTLLFTLLFALIFSAFAINGIGQELPEYGKLDEIKGKKLVYVATDNPEGRKQIVNALKRSSLTVVDKPEDAEFFIGYKIAGQFDSKASLILTSDIGQMDVYYLRDGRRVLVFSDTHISAIKNTAADGLTKKFLKRLKKLS